MINSSSWQPPRRGKCPVVDRPSVPAWSRGRSWRRGYGVPLSCWRRQVRRQGPTELTISQFSALATGVVRAGPLGVGQLAEAEVLPSPAVTRLADKLEEAGLCLPPAQPCGPARGTAGGD